MFSFFLSKPPLPQFGLVSDFRLTSSEGTPVTRQTLEGSIWIVDFMFTRCQGPCPRLSQGMATLHHHFEKEPLVREVSITVDPDYDTPAVLSAYAKVHGADLSRWFFLTGPTATISTLMIKSFKVGDSTAMTAHSTRFILVDRSGIIRGYYDGLTLKDLKTLQRHVRQLIRES